MEVHPPHEPVHTWRDALIHIGLMTVGLFIALSLEGLIEYVHHKELVHHARETIREELKSNDDAVAFNISQIDPNLGRVKSNIAALQKIEVDPDSSPAMSYDWHFATLSDTAWRTARDTGALAYMPYEEVQNFAAVYRLQDQISADLVTVFKRESESLGPVIAIDKERDVAKGDLQFAIHENAVATVELYNLKQLLQGLHEAYVSRLKQASA